MKSLISFQLSLCGYLVRGNGHKSQYFFPMNPRCLCFPSLKKKKGDNNLYFGQTLWIFFKVMHVKPALLYVCEKRI